MASNSDAKAIAKNIRGIDKGNIVSADTFEAYVNRFIKNRTLFNEVKIEYGKLPMEGVGWLASGISPTITHIEGIISHPNAATNATATATIPAPNIIAPYGAAGRNRNGIPAHMPNPNQNMLGLNFSTSAPFMPNNDNAASSSRPVKQRINNSERILSSINNENNKENNEDNSNKYNYNGTDQLITLRRSPRIAAQKAIRNGKLISMMGTNITTFVQPTRKRKYQQMQEEGERITKGFNNSMCTTDKFLNISHIDYINNGLKIIDTFHDFWETGRPLQAFKGASKEAKDAYLHILFLNIINSINKVSINKLIELPYYPISDERNYYFLKREAQNKLNTITIDKNIIAQSGVGKFSFEEMSAYNFGCIPLPDDMPFTSDKRHKQERYKTMIKNLFQIDLKDLDAIYYTRDAGANSFGELGTFDGSKLKQLITQCTVADSANTPAGGWGDSSLMGKEGGDTNVTYYQFVNKGPIGDEFLSDSNIFTGDTYKISYKNIEFNYNLNSMFSLIIEKYGEFKEQSDEFKEQSDEFKEQSDEFKEQYDFAKKIEDTQVKIAKSGPSVGLLSIYNIFSQLKQMERGLILYIDDERTPVTVEKAITICEAYIRTFISSKSMLLLQDNEGVLLCNKNSIDPALFLDIKRGGDRDQVMAALKFKEDLNSKNPKEKVVFCTGDILCATIAVRAGLATILQSDKSIMYYWKENSNNQLYPNSTKLGSDTSGKSGGAEIKKSTKNIESNTFVYNISEFIHNMSDIAANYVRSKISILYPEICRLCALYILRNRVRYFYETTPQKTIENYKTITDRKHYIDFPVENAIESFRQLNNNKDIVTLKDILTNDKNTNLKILETKIEEYEESISTYSDSKVKDKILNDIDFDKTVIMSLKEEIERNWNANSEFMKIMSVPTNKKLYMYFKSLIYTDISKTQGRNNYSNLVVALSLFNDFINNTISGGTSVISKLIYGSSPVKYKWVQFSQETLPEYLTLFKNIYNNYKTSADFMNVVPESLKAATSVRANKTKSNQQTRKNIQGRRNNIRRQPQESTRKNIRQLIPISQQQPANITVSGGKLYPHKTHKRHRRHHKRLHTHRKR